MNSSDHTEFLSWDDTAIISENPVVNSGLSLENIILALKTEVLNLWHPLTLWSHQLDVTLFGLNPDLHHLSALFYHLLAGLALFFALCQIKSPSPFTGAGQENSAQKPTGQALVSKPIAFVTTLLFLLHPMHVESWAWLSERKDTLSALFAFLSLGFWARFIGHQPSKLNYTLSLLFLTCGLMSKPSLIVWPAVLLLTAQWQAPHKNLKAHLPTLKKLIPHLLICLIIAGITYSFQLNRGEGIIKVIATRSPHENLIVGFNNIWIYLSKIFFPHPLSYFYQPLQTYPFAGGTLGLTLSLLLTYFSWRLRHSFPLLLWAWGSFFVTLAPVCGFIVAGEANAPDRYSYLAYTGPFLLLTILASKGVRRLNLPPQQAAPISSLLTVIILIPLTCLTILRAPAWKNMETLTAAAIKAHPNSYAPHNHLALYYLAQDQTQKARHHIERSLELREGNRYLWAKLGMIELQAGNSALAQKHFLKQLVHAPNHLNAHVGLSKIYLETNNFRAALPHLEKASQLAPNNKAYPLAAQQCREAIK
ncbi:MAG: tetratricopeptide repeat protein [Roseibacillus sp.]